MSDELVKCNMRSQDHGTFKALAEEEGNTIVEQVGKILTFYVEHKDAKEDPQVAELQARIVKHDEELLKAHAEIERLEDLRDTIVESKPEMVLKTGAMKEVAQINQETKRIEVEGHKEITRVKETGATIRSLINASVGSDKYDDVINAALRDLDLPLLPPPEKPALSAAKGQ